MKRKISLGAAVTLAIMFSTVTFIMTMIYAQNDFNGKVYALQQRERMYAKLSEVDTKVRKEYFNQIDEEKLRDSLILGYVQGLGDRYGIYLTAEQHAQTMSDFDGKMVDVGLVCLQDTSGYILVEKVVSGSAAETEGIEAGDLIVKVDEMTVTAENFAEAVDSLKGEPGTTVELTIRRGGNEKVYSVTRRRVEVLSSDYHIFDNVGYISITEFNHNTPEQFSRALSAVIEYGVKGLVFDVRSNPGGTMDSVAAILDLLLPAGPIVSATDKNGQTVVLHQSDENEITLPMAVLINQKTASAAELFAQALKDYNKAKLVGTQSDGKGSMQKIYPLSDGSALDITVARYNPPFSENFDGVGVKPDYGVKISPELEKMLTAPDPYVDPQLKKAMEVVDAQIRDVALPEPDSEIIEGEEYVFVDPEQEEEAGAPIDQE